MTFPSFKSLDVAVAAASIIVLLGLVFRNSRRVKTTQLIGPPAASFVFGVAKKFFVAKDPSQIHASWAEQYGPAFAAPLAFGSKSIVICDPKAAAHFHAKETFIYQNIPVRRNVLKNVLGGGIIWAEGETHRRQRRALTPAFSNAAIRKITPEFYDSVYKVKSHWDNLLTQGDALIEVQQWLNKISLDSLGHAAFGHHFGSLDGKKSDISDIFQTFASATSAWSRIVFVISQVVPWLINLPTKDGRVRAKFSRIGKGIADDLLEREHRLADWKGTEEMEGDKSILGTLLRSERSLSESNRTSTDEVIAQIKTLLLAGYETTSSSMTWILIELCRHPEAQKKLRQELLDKFPNNDPTWDDLWYKLPYLDAVVLESLRLHPVLPEILRVATEDDIIPLSRPATTTSGEQVSSLFIAKGSIVSTSLGGLNRYNEIWGPDAGEYIPERWLNLDESDVRAKEIQGHKHIMSFSDGPRICLGKNFALAEIKAVLAVLIKSYIFEFEKGVDGKIPSIEIQQGLTKRPKLEGTTGAEVPLRVSKVEL